MHHGKIPASIAKGLAVLRQRIRDAKIPSSCLDETINIATWNIREFGKRRRRKSSIHYIAEIIGQFDVVAIVEARDNMDEFTELLRILGPYWRVVFSDYLTDAGGNRERIAYVYDTRAATFTGLASFGLPMREKHGSEYLARIGWWRNPYVASFRSGSFDFILLAVHIRWGTGTAGRKEELDLLAQWIERRSQEQFWKGKDLIVLGDFNIPSTESALFEAITSRGLRMAPALTGTHGSNLAKNKRYDQILHDPRRTQSFTSHGGVVDFYRGDHRRLYPGTRITKAEFTWEMSDHLPLWIQVATDVEAALVNA